VKNKTTEKDKENYSDENHVVINCDSVSPKAFLTSNAEPPNPAPKLETRSGYKASPKETSDAAKQSSAHVAIDCTPPPVESCPPAPPPQGVMEEKVKHEDEPEEKNNDAVGAASSGALEKGEEEDVDDEEKARREVIYALYNQRSNALCNMREFKYALSDAKLCIKSQPKNPRGYVRKANALEGLRKNQQAVEAYKIACKLDPENGLLKKKMTECQFRANASKYGYSGGRVF